MARIRSVKPELRTSQVVASWPFETRYFWVLLWGYLDDKGRGLDIPKTIAGDCFPHDEKITARTIDKWLDLMTTKADGQEGPVCRYEVAGRRYLHALDWTHQRINRPTPSRLPQCPIHEGLTEPLTESPPTSSLPGAAEQQSRGAGEQQQRRDEPGGEPPPRPAAERLLLEALETEGCTGPEARALAEQVQRDRKPRNLVGLLRTIAQAGELPALLAGVRATAAKANTATAMDAIRRSPPCAHGTNGGDQPHPTSGRPVCALCRTATTRDHEGATRDA